MPLPLPLPHAGEKHVKRKRAVGAGSTEARKAQKSICIWIQNSLRSYSSIHVHKLAKVGDKHPGEQSKSQSVRECIGAWVENWKLPRSRDIFTCGCVLARLTTSQYFVCVCVCVFFCWQLVSSYSVTVIELYINTVIESVVVGLGGGTRQEFVELSMQAHVRLLTVRMQKYLEMIWMKCLREWLL